MSETLTQELKTQVDAKLKTQAQTIAEHSLAKSSTPLNGATKDIYVAIFKEGAVQREYRFYAPEEDKSIEDLDKRKKDRNKRIWLLCKRYEIYLRSTENRKVAFVGIPQPFVRDIESEMREFEENMSKPAHKVW